jgi:PAP2 superfamily
MKKIKQIITQNKKLIGIASRLLGLIGSFACMAIYVSAPSWPTPDKLLVFMVFVFMVFGRSVALLKRFVPFVGLLLAYESLRGLVPHLNSRVEFQWMIDADRFIGMGNLPTQMLQELLWEGAPKWFDFGLYGVYMLHFILPFCLALLIWKYRVAEYWRYVTAFILVSFAGFLTFLIMPAAPPWMASNEKYIEPISRISSSVWYELGIQDFPSLYNKISPNPVAAVPSLHAAYATLFAVYVWRIFGRKLGLLSAVYPVLIYFGTVYQGEHYLIDEIIGSIYAVTGYTIVSYAYPFLLQYIRKGSTPVKKPA